MTLWLEVEPLVVAFQVDSNFQKLCKDGTFKSWNYIGNKLALRGQLEDLVLSLVEQRTMPVSEIASELGVSVTTVRRACRTLKIGRYVPCSSGIVNRSSQAPFGWDIVHGRLVRNQMEWSWVEKTWNLRAQEVSLRKIPTKNGGRWFAKTVSQILKFNRGHFTGTL